MNKDIKLGKKSINFINYTNNELNLKFLKILQSIKQSKSKEPLLKGRTQYG
jgi:hypothetical protein